MIQEDDLHFYLKIHSPQAPSTHFTSKKQSPGFSTNEALDGLKWRSIVERINLQSSNATKSLSTSVSVITDVDNSLYEPEHPCRDRLQKIRPVVDYTAMRFQSVYLSVLLL